MQVSCDLILDDRCCVRVNSIITFSSMDVKETFLTYLEQLKRNQSDPSLGKGNSSKAMSCEGCSQKFTVFKRKKLCNICLRYFCTNCLSPQLGPNGNNSVLSRLTDRRHICATCLVLTARPLCRFQLKRLKVKDLQHYLTAQRVSTRGCVEKDDLVNLLICHVGSSNSGSNNENICDSHSDLSSLGNGSQFSNPTLNRPPPPRDLPRTASNSSANDSPSHRASQQSSAANTSSTSATGSTVHNEGCTSTSFTANRPVRTPTGSDDGFEIVELTEDWSGDPDESGPDPVVEEMTDSAAGSVSSPTSCSEHEILSSSTTSLGEPNIATTSSSSPSQEQSPGEGIEPTTEPEPSTVPMISSTPPPIEEMEEADPSAIHSEAFDENTDLQQVRPPVITLNTIKSLEQLQNMSVKQIKELLMRNRVDFRGCCERSELVERATRLWIENKESRRALERLGSTEMCKICMDAPIECVMLECGHMATCMSCGKQLSECPLCRQFVVRVVRIFRA